MAPGLTSDVSTAETHVGSSVKPTVYLLDTFHPEAVSYAQKLFNAILPGTAEHSRWRTAEYLLIRSSHFTAEDVRSCPNLKAIGKQGVGTDKIDLIACNDRNIKVLNTPGVNARAVAELVLALVTSVARDVTQIAIAQARGELVPKESCSGLILNEKTMGIVGMGHIGKMVARIFRGAFDADIVAYDPYAPTNAWEDLSHRRVDSLEELLRISDVVSVHVPLTTQTRGLISYREMSLMKPTAIVVNASRGGIVNEHDLRQALEKGLIWGAGLDCHEQEPPSVERYECLWSHRVVSTPHIGAATSQTQKETAMAAVTILHKFAMSQR